MNGWLIFGLIFAGINVWSIFFGTRVREMTIRRHKSICPRKANDWSTCQSHAPIGVFGYVLGPLMWIMVEVYEVADGTSRRRLRAWRDNRKTTPPTELRSAA